MTRVFTPLTLALGLAATGALADEPVCMPVERMKATLIDMYGEHPQPGAIRTATAVTQFWASHETGSWTLVKVLADGTACAIDDGENYAADPQMAELRLTR